MKAGAYSRRVGTIMNSRNHSENWRGGSCGYNRDCCCRYLFLGHKVVTGPQAEAEEDEGLGDEESHGGDSQGDRGGEQGQDLGDLDKRTCTLLHLQRELLVTAPWP